MSEFSPSIVMYSAHHHEFNPRRNSYNEIRPVPNLAPAGTFHSNVHTRVTRAYSLFHIKRTNAKQKHGNTRAYAHAARVQACRARTRSVAAGLEREEEEVGASQPARVHLGGQLGQLAARVVRHSAACARSSAGTGSGDARRAGVRGLSCGSGAGDVAGDGDDVAVADGSSKGEGGDRRVVGEKNMLDRAATMTSAAAGSASGSCAPAPVRARSSMSGMAKDGNACGQVIGRQPPVGCCPGE